MPRIVWVLATNPAKKYVTTIQNDPNVPAGYVLTNTSDGSAQIADGIHDVQAQTFVGGLWSGGYPPYNGYTDGSATNGKLGGN